MASTKIVLVGAGSAVFGVRLISDLVFTEGLRGSHLVLVDIDSERLDMVYRIGTKLIAEQDAKLRLSKCEDYREALSGADYVITTVARGGAGAWLNDVRIPQAYGYNYAVGDTMGPGGLFRALRTIPLVVDIAREMEEACPDALLINYSNPMTAICRAVNKYTSIRAIGLCHGLQNTVRRISPRLGLEPSEITAWASGINHFIWLTDIVHSVTGEDLYPKLVERAKKMPSEQPVAYDLLNTYGLFPSGGDDHIVEFIQYYTSHECGKGAAHNIDLNYVEKAVAHQKQELEELEKLASVPSLRATDAIQGTAESAAEIIDCLSNAKTGVFMVNVPNNGRIPNLPAEAVVEVPGITTPSGVMGVQVEALPLGIAGRITACIHEFELMVEAAVHGERRLALQALLINPFTRSRVDAERLLDELIKANEPYLEQFR
ncbi:MAG: alpha-glucosidase/alpha-galactosidase [Firmicutes bacterium]|nr:alpha-glucosidase/alpha-galactosidase [Bacillota bacterium]